MGQSQKIVPQLEKWVTGRKMGHTSENGSTLEKWVTLRKLGHSQKIM